MRELLAPLAWRRHRFVATVGPWRDIRGHLCLCLRDLADEATGEDLAEHCWARWPGEKDLALVPGVRVAFRATPRPYERGCGGGTDYHLTGLRQVRTLTEEAAMAPDWEKLARCHGPQPAPYMRDAEWDGKTRSIRCGCGAIIEILADEPSDGHECSNCTLKRALTLEAHYRAHRASTPVNAATEEV